jgi:hypothetical protein
MLDSNEYFFELVKERILFFNNLEKTRKLRPIEEMSLETNKKLFSILAKQCLSSTPRTILQ